MKNKAYEKEREALIESLIENNLQESNGGQCTHSGGPCVYDCECCSELCIPMVYPYGICGNLW